MTHFDAVLLEKAAVTDRISTFRFGLAGESALPDWTAGAHVELTLQDGTMRPYSLISWTAEVSGPRDYTIAVQREEAGTGGSIAMHALEVGAKVTVSAPKNDFPLDTGAPAVLLAGGIGITPMISMASSLTARGAPFAFHYAGRSADLMAFRSEVQSQFGAQIHCDDDNSALDLDAIITNLADAHLYVCGPRGMIDAARAKAESAGIDPARVHFELFESASAQDGDSPFEVEINDGQVFTIPVGATIIEVLEEAGVDVMYDCQRGDCGICQCDVLEGIPDHRDVVLSDTERAAGEVMQICVSRAKSPRLKLDI